MPYVTIATVHRLQLIQTEQCEHLSMTAAIGAVRAGDSSSNQTLLLRYLHRHDLNPRYLLNDNKITQRKLTSYNNIL
jgi:hypothetical protein